MLIDCPSCARSYPLDRAALGDSGRMVVCPRCATRWFVAAPEAADEPTVDEPNVERPGLAADDLDRLLPRHRPGAGGVPRPRKTRDRGTVRPAFAGAVALVLLGLVVPMGAIAKRATIVRAVPRTAALYAAIGLPVNLRGLAIGDVRTTALDDGRRGLEIAGTIRNIEKSRTVVPKLSFEIRDARGTTLAHWAEPAPRRQLAADESVAFLTQAPAVPDGSKEVLVRFETPQDVGPVASPLLRKPQPPG